MGKRKRATKPPPKKKTAKLEKIFNCPICGHEESVECFIDRGANMGVVECRTCGAKYSALIHSIEEEVDVFAKWIDALEVANQERENEKQQLEERRRNVAVRTEDGDEDEAGLEVAGIGDEDDDDDDDDF